METRYHYVSLDSDKDLSGNVLTVSVDSEEWVTAEHHAAPTSAGSLPTPADGFTRYWWRVLIGPGQPLDPTGRPEPLTLYGRLTDTPEVLYPSWVLGSNEPDPAPGLTDYCWPVVIPTPALTEWNGTDAATRAYAEALAVLTLRSLTGNQVGGCPVVVYPCRSGCLNGSEATWRSYPVAGGGPSRASVYPVLDSGRWYNVGCGSCTGCGPRNGLRLPEARGGVVSVVLAGTPLPASAWTFDGTYLHRTDGQPWTFSPGELVVTVYPRPRPDGLAALAAGALAVEYAKARAGAGCRLPARATQVARAGTTVQLGSLSELFTEGVTGIMEADLFIRSINPHRLLTAPTVWSPDLPRR